MSAHPESAAFTPQILEQPALVELSHAQGEPSRFGAIGRNVLSGIASSRAVRGALALGLAVGAGTAVGVASEMADPRPRAAAADTGGYPDYNKPCVAGDPEDPNSSYGKTEGTGYWCSGYQWGDSPTQQDSSRGYGYRNCTDWVAWRVQNAGVGSVPGGWSHGKYWDNNAPAGSVDNTPEPGDIAVWDAGNFGHVAFVESVNANGTVNVSEYNKGQNGNYGTRNGVTADHYIDLNGAGKGLHNETWPPVTDTDSDGVGDSQDDCPNKAGVASFYGCPAYTPPGSSEPLTAESPYGTALSSWGDQRLDAFRVNANGELEHRSFDHGSWTGWENLGGNIVGKPAAVSWGWGRIDVFAIGADGKLKQKLIDNNSGWSQWIDLSTIPGSPSCLKNGLAATQWGPGDLDVFGIDCGTNSMKHVWLRNNQWQGGEDLGGCIQNAPAAVAWGADRIDTFVRGCDNALYTKYVDVAGWSGWVGLGGCLASGPAVASQAPQRLDVFARGCAVNSLLHMAYRPNEWSPWENWGGNIAQAPSAVSWKPNRLDVIGTDPANQTTHFHFNREAPSSGWGTL